jgi:hypothetical protein
LPPDLCALDVRGSVEPETGDIQVTTDDPDLRDTFKHTVISNRESSKRYHPTFYRRLAALLTQHGKTVPDWEGDAAAK